MRTNEAESNPEPASLDIPHNDECLTRMYTTTQTIQDTNRRENKSAARARQVHFAYFAYGLRWQVERKCGPKLMENEMNMHAVCRDERLAVVLARPMNDH